MPVSLTLNTFFAGGSAYLSNCKAQLLSKNNAGLFVVRESINISTSGTSSISATVNFTQTVNGRIRMCVRDRTTDVLIWRSVELDQLPEGTPFRFSILQVDQAQTTFTSGKFEDEIDLPIVQDVDDLDEDVIVQELDVTFKHDHIDVDGKGKLAKGEDWTILGSKFDFDFDFNLKPSTSIDHKRLIKVVSKAFSINFDNVITGIGASCMQDGIKAQVKDSVQSKINKAIRNALRDKVEDQFGDDNDLTKRTSATIQLVTLQQTGTTTVTVPTGVGPDTTLTLPVHSLIMQVDVSVPTELIEQSSSQGCAGVIALAAIPAGVVAAASLLT